MLTLGWRVEEVEVEVVQAELLEGVDEGVESRLVAVVGVPQLCGDKDLLTRSIGTSTPGFDSSMETLCQQKSPSASTWTQGGLTFHRLPRSCNEQQSRCGDNQRRARR